MSNDSAVRFLDRTTPPHILTLILLAGLSALAMNIFLPSLTGMADYFETDYRLIQLSVALYLGVNAVLQVFVGPISDRFGRRPVILWGIGLFILATIGCLFAPNVEIFLAFRMGQAVIVAGMVLSRAVVRDMVSQDEAASMIGYLTMGMSVVPMIGPAIGGVLDAQFGWQASFVLMLALGVLIFFLAYRDLGETARKSSSSMREQFREYPELFGSRRFWGYVLCATFASGSFFAYLGGAPYVATEVYHLTPDLTGIYFGAPALGYFAGNYVSGKYSRRVGVNKMILWGSIICALGMLVSLLIFTFTTGSVEIFFAFMTFVGLGNGMVLPNANAGMLSVRPHLAGTASGIGGAIMIGGGAALSAFAGTLLGPGSGATPLIALMFTTSALGVAAIVYVLRREQEIA
ncbi:multidrug effflux MFS transporter [Halocynthiibacter sp. C4]|uniref:multidrug effflux MFS transporter n=1 Tax=Halocynthiibacter sp. C4 TaxID=2992758 RepID=UPI00237A1779|nr:multidrug effflux MFS transporter [Halocynthiibacter sp. C4]MDE0590205.1 multidrug effflux MFS transporter [Halocynthiibacter sp. C4]